MNITAEIEKLKTLNHPSIQRFIDYSFVGFENQPNQLYSVNTKHKIIKAEMTQKS